MVSPQDSKKKVPQRALWRRLWRPLRVVGLILLCLLLVLVVAFSLPMTRGGILSMVLDQAHRFLPGELTVENVSWPHLGRFEFQGLVWRVAAADSLENAAVGDTLAQISDLVLDVDLQSLRDHDLLIREVFLQAGPVNIPGIIAFFPASEAASVPRDTTAAKPFLREGELPMVPSVGLLALQVQVRDVQVDETLTVTEAGMAGMLELRAGHGAAVHLERGTVQLELQQDELLVLKVDSLGLDLSVNADQQEFLVKGFTVRVPEAGPPAVLKTWREAEMVTLRVDGSGSWTTTGLSVALAGDCDLPGMDHLRPIFPPELPLEVSGPLVGGFELEATVEDLSAPNPTGWIRADFSQTSWLDRLILDASLDQGKAQIDTLDLAAFGVRLAVSGVVDSTEVDMRLAMGLHDPTLLHLFGGPDFADADAGLDLQAELRGLWPIPDVDLDLTAFAKVTQLELPSLRGRVRARDRLVEVALNLDEGLSSGAVALDSLELNWAGNLSRPDSLTHEFDLEVWAPLGRLALGGTGLIDSVRTVLLDSLVIAGLDSTMRTPHPVTIVHGPGPKDLRVENLVLEGGLGSLVLDGNLDATGLTLKMVADLLFREDFLMEVAPNELWRRDGGTDLSISAAIDLEGGAGGPVFTGHAGALMMPHRDHPQIGLDLKFHLVQGDSSGLGADLLLHADENPLITGIFLWPGRPDLESGQWIPDLNQGLEVRFPRQGFDLALLNPVMPSDVSLSGVLDFGAELVEISGNEDKKIFLQTALLNGHVGVEDLDVELPNRSRISLNIDADLSGTVVDPGIKGRVKVVSGFFRIPEMPPTLLPVKGESLLWQAMADQAAAEGDTAYVMGASQQGDLGPVLGEEHAVFIPDLDLTLEIPGNLIINGYGLNVELEGELKVTRAQDHKGVPMAVMNGRIGVRQGTLKFMNNVFDVEKADIRFNKSAPPNPHLDVRLTADVSGYLLHLEVTGFADDPTVELTSEPDMNEADIMAVLLFGQPANDLDNDQRGRANEENDPGAQMKENLAAMAVMFGGAGIQNQMTNALGVDMVEMGSGSDGDNTIMVGKFITPRVLLKYNQSLEKSGTYFMTLEYTLSKYFKFLSTYGQGEEASGLELKWTRRY